MSHACGVHCVCATHSVPVCMTGVNRCSYKHTRVLFPHFLSLHSHIQRRKQKRSTSCGHQPTKVCKGTADRCQCPENMTQPPIYVSHAYPQSIAIYSTQVIDSSNALEETVTCMQIVYSMYIYGTVYTHIQMCMTPRCLTVVTGSFSSYLVMVCMHTCSPQTAYHVHNSLSYNANGTEQNRSELKNKGCMAPTTRQHSPSTPCDISTVTVLV